MKRFLLSFAILLELASMGCTSYSEEIGSGFIVRTRVSRGISHKYEERDLYYRGALGIRRLIHKDIAGAKVSPKGDRILFFARRPRPEPLGMDYILYVFDVQDKDLVKIAEGEFFYTHDYWCPDGQKLVYVQYDAPIVLFDLNSQKAREIASKGFLFRGWSPSGKKIAYSTGKSKYDMNSLYCADLLDSSNTLISEKKGPWRKEDFEWVTLEGEEELIVK
jgi:Tol biopolymer transport system component